MLFRSRNILKTDAKEKKVKKEKQNAELVFTSRDPGCSESTANGNRACGVVFGWSGPPFAVPFLVPPDFQDREGGLPALGETETEVVVV